MTTLNEKAREYAKNAKCTTYEDLTLLHRPEHVYNTTQYYQTGLYIGYIAGATEMTRWRDVNVELPILKEKVLVKNNNGVVDIACLWDEKTNTFYISQYGTDGIFLHFDYWRPIEII